MIKKIHIVFLIVLTCFLKSSACALVAINHPPLEMIVFDTPKDVANEWKEINRSVTENIGTVEYIPSDQQIENWSEIICIQYREKSFFNKEFNSSLDAAMEMLRLETLKSYPGCKVTWNILDKNQSDVIFEWILHNQYKDVPPQHEIARAFITDKGFHRIGYTRQYREMNPDERNKWYTALKESAVVVNLEEAVNEPQKLSFIDKLKDSLELGADFQDWKDSDSLIVNNGLTIVGKIPPWNKDGYECLVIKTLPIYNMASLDKLYEFEKELIQECSYKKIKFYILKKSSNEIIFNCFYPYFRDNLKVNEITRLFITDKGYYSVRYMLALPYKFKEKEIRQWQSSLEKIKVRK